jgi:hypothetical protein
MGEISPGHHKVAQDDPPPLGSIMHLGSKAFPKISWTSRRIRLGVAHHGAPSGWVAPTKDADIKPEKKQKKNRR